MKCTTIHCNVDSAPWRRQQPKAVITHTRVSVPQLLMRMSLRLSFEYEYGFFERYYWQLGALWQWWKKNTVSVKIIFYKKQRTSDCKVNIVAKIKFEWKWILSGKSYQVRNQWKYGMSEFCDKSLVSVKMSFERKMCRSGARIKISFESKYETSVVTWPSACCEDFF